MSVAYDKNQSHLAHTVLKIVVKKTFLFMCFYVYLVYHYISANFRPFFYQLSFILDFELSHQCTYCTLEKDDQNKMKSYYTTQQYLYSQDVLYIVIFILLRCIAYTQVLVLHFETILQCKIKYLQDFLKIYTYAYTRANYWWLCCLFLNSRQLVTFLRVGIWGLFLTLV